MPSISCPFHVWVSTAKSDFETYLLPTECLYIVMTISSFMVVAESMENCIQVRGRHHIEPLIYAKYIIGMWIHVAFHHAIAIKSNVPCTSLVFSSSVTDLFHKLFPLLPFQWEGCVSWTWINATKTRQLEIHNKQHQSIVRKWSKLFKI